LPRRGTVTQSDGHGEQRETISQIPAPRSLLSGHMRRRRFGKPKAHHRAKAAGFQYVRLRCPLAKSSSCDIPPLRKAESVVDEWIVGLTRPRRLWRRQMGAKGEEQLSCLPVLVRVVGELRPPSGVRWACSFRPWLGWSINSPTGRVDFRRASAAAAVLCR
jgi:hypothetical protein